MKKTLIAMLTLVIGIMAVSCKKADVLPSSVSVTPSSATVTEGETANFSATVLPADAVYSGITWSSSDTKVATVSNGVVTGVKAGSATITATADGVSGTATVTVNAKVFPVQSVSLDKTELELTEGDETQLTATVAPDNATDKSVSWKSSNTSVATVSSSGKVTAVKAGTATITVTTQDGGKTATCAVNVLSESLPGKFSVSSTKQIQFSKGNLVATIDATGAPTAWKFAANQYDCLGEGGANKTIGSAAGDVDLFGWPTAATKYGISTSESYGDYSGDFVDWGKNIGDGSTWRTLTTEEWQYLFRTRTNASRLHKHGVTVCGKIKCLIIAPDGYTGTIAASYDASTWPVAEAAGLVCLPAAGCRIGSYVRDVGVNGYYWSSTARGSGSAYSVHFHTGLVHPGGYDLLSYGSSVRLITESK